MFNTGYLKLTENNFHILVKKKREGKSLCPVTFKGELRGNTFEFACQSCQNYI